MKQRSTVPSGARLPNPQPDAFEAFGSLDDPRALKRPWALLGGLSPQQFMRRHWQRQPLMVRGAWPGVQPPADRASLWRLAATEGVESRCVEHTAKGWRLRHGPFGPRALPPRSRPGWTLLVQGLDLHLDAAHAMLRRFGFIAQARLDDLMLSYASDGGGVGPHVDSYDVFLLQVQGRRRWRVAPPGQDRLVPGLPLRILADFEPQQEWVLEPGDMLYLPPGWGHDGVAVGGDCMTASIGFRSPTAGELATSLLERVADELGEALQDVQGSPEGTRGQGPRRGAPRSWQCRHADPGLGATPSGGHIPPGLERFALEQVQRLMQDTDRWQRALGCWVTEPKANVWFDGSGDDDGAAPGWFGLNPAVGVALDRRSRVAYDDRHFYLNGEAFRVGGRDAELLHRLADRRALGAADCRRLSADAREALEDWVREGWLRVLAFGAS